VAVPRGGGGRVSAVKISVVVVSYNTRERLLACLDALAARVSVPHEVIVVDNASADGSAAAVRARFPAAIVLENAENAGFSRANNQGLRRGRGAYALILNSDAEVGAGCVEALAAVLDARADVGIVGPRTRFADGRIQVSFGPMLAPRAEWRQRRLVRGVGRGDPPALRRAEALAAVEHEPAWVSGSCLLARRRAIDAVGLFDEGFFLYEEDVDLCVRVRRAGWRIVFTPTAEVVHHLGSSMAQATASIEYHRSHLRFYAKHHGWGPRLVLRGALAARGGLGWLTARGPRAREDRRHAAALVRLVLAGK
jgi:N-acetylglucosaminyl-diphospho-decaprenol L-rhamnosyltransferase